MNDNDLTLNLAPLVIPESRPNQTIDERFRDFVEANPYIVLDLISIIDGARERGLDQYSVKAAYEVLRWYHTRLTDDQPFRLNNSYTSRFARLIIERRPDLAAMIRTRELRAA